MDNCKEIPVLLVVAGDKIIYLPRVIGNLSEMCGFNLFYVICPSKDLEYARFIVSSAIQDVKIIDENFIIEGLDISEVSRNLNLLLPGWPERHLSGWYYQQFLKMGFSKFASGYDHYLIWDADTLLTRPISFFEGNLILLTQGNEYHVDYFRTIKSLIDGINISSRSHISQHLMVKTQDMLSLLEKLDVSGTPWWLNILNALSGKSPFQFSEYEMYSNYCLTFRSTSYRSIRRHWFRYGSSYCGSDLITAKVIHLSKLYDFVAFENWDHGFIRMIRSRMLVICHRLKLML